MKFKEIPVYVWFDSDEFLDQTLEALSYTLKEGFDVSRRFPIKVVGDRWGKGKFGSVDWYFKHTFHRKGDYGLQYDASRVLSLCELEPYQKSQPHIEFGITEKDLYSGFTNFVYGVSRTITPSYTFTQVEDEVRVAGSLLSFCRIKEWYGEKASEIFFMMNVHEFSHLFDVPSRNYEVEHTLGTHCIRSDCVMGQVNVERDVLGKDGRVAHRFIGADENSENVLERYSKTGSYFCHACKNDLTKRKKYLIRELFT